MNKAELISAVAVKTGLSKKDSEKAINATFEAITTSLEAGEKVQLVGFGAFEAKVRPARKGHNPMTGKAAVHLFKNIRIVRIHSRIHIRGKRERSIHGSAQRVVIIFTRPMQ